MDGPAQVVGAMSRQVLTLVVTTAVTMAMLFGAGVGMAMAHDGGNDVGASGNCDDGDSGGGGGGSAGASYDGSVDATNASELQSVINGFTHYANQYDGSDDPCDNHKSDYDSYDYVEAHAWGPNGNNGVQYCYSQNNSNDNGQLTTNGSDACGHS